MIIYGLLLLYPLWTNVSRHPPSVSSNRFFPHIGGSKDFFYLTRFQKRWKHVIFSQNFQLNPPPSIIPSHGKNSGSAPVSCFVLFLLWNTVHSEKGFEITWSLKFCTWFTMMYMFGCMYTFHSPIDSGYSSSKSTVFTIPISPNVHDVRTTL